MVWTSAEDNSSAQQLKDCGQIVMRDNREFAAIFVFPANVTFECVYCI